MPWRPRPIAAVIGPMVHGSATAECSSFLRIAGVVAGVAFGAPLADAQNAPTAVPGAPKSETTLPGVTVTDTTRDYLPDVSSVGAKQPTALRDIPQTVNVVNRAVLDAQAATSLQDALRYVPGITIGSAEGGSIGNNINLRGFSARTDIFLDGMRDRGQYYRDTFFLESIEVLKGPSSMLFGRGSTGGVINQVSKTPSLRSSNEASLVVGTSDFYRATADFNQRLSDTGAFRVAVMGQDVQTTRDVMRNKDVGAAPSLRLGIGTPTEITLSALVEHNRDMPDYGLPPLNGEPAPVSHDAFFGLTDDRTVQDVATVGARVRHRVSSNLTLRNQTQYSHYTTDARETGPNRVGTFSSGIFTALPTATVGNGTSLPTSQLVALLGSHDRKIDDDSLFNQTDVIAKLDTGPLKHSLIAGLEIGRDNYTNQTYTRTDPTIGGVNPGLAIVSLEHPEYRTAPANTLDTATNRVDSTGDTVAVYVNDTIDLTPQWKAVGGIRQDRFKADISNSITAPAQAAQTVNFTSVRAGGIFQPTETQSYYAAYGTSFDPSLETLALTAGQQNLPPEKNKSYEVGAKIDVLEGNLSLTSALFEVRKTNARSQISTGIYELTGNVRTRGFELGAAGRLTKDWQLLAGYTYLDAKIVSASLLDASQGKVPANTPRHNASLWTTYNVTTVWEVGGGVTYASSTYANNSNVVQVPGYTRFDATLAYHQPRYDVRLNVINLTDKAYFFSVIPSDGGRSVPGIGRTALVTATYKF